MDRLKVRLIHAVTQLVDRLKVRLIQQLYQYLRFMGILYLALMFDTAL
jgi:hypothetical protein